METTSQSQLLALAREFYGRVTYTHKTHEKDRELWTGRAARAKAANICLAGVTTAFAIGSAINPASKITLFVTCLFAGLNTAFVIYQLSFDPSGKSDEHRRVAKDLLTLRDQYLILIQEILVSNVPTDRLLRSLETLCAETSLVYKYAPDSSARAYRLASKGLKRDQESTFSNDEIDRLLPDDLRRAAVRAPSAEV